MRSFPKTVKIYQKLLYFHDYVVDRFRNHDEWVKVANHIAVDPKQVVKKLEEMFIEYNSTIVLRGF